MMALKTYGIFDYKLAYQQELTVEVTSILSGGTAYFDHKIIYCSPRDEKEAREFAENYNKVVNSPLMKALS